MKNTLTVLLIEDSVDYAGLVQQWLSTRTDITFVLNWTHSLRAGLNRLSQGGIDVVLLDLGLPDSDGLETFNRTKLQATGVPIILLSGSESEALALQMVKDGAEDYIVKGSCTGDSLAKALQYAVVRHGSREERTEAESAELATVVGVMAAKGGVGGTTIACNLAAELREQTTQSTLLADLDLDGGMVGFLMGAQSGYSILDAVGNVDRLDVVCWEGLVTHCAGNLDVLRSPSLPGVAEPDADHLRQVLAVIRKLYRWMVVDLGRPSRFSLGLLEHVNELLLVTSTSIPALYEAKRVINGLRVAGFEGDRIRIVVNQFSRTNELSESETGQYLGVPVYATFAVATQTLRDACVKRTLPGKTTDFRVQMAVLARKLAGLEPEKPRSRVSQIFSFSKKPSAVDTVSSTAGSV